MAIKLFKNKGFSLVEMLVYIAILVFVLAIIIEVVLSVARSERVISSVRSIENSAVLALERISREIRQSDSVNVSSSVLGSHPGILVLNGEDLAGNPRTVEFYLSNSRLNIRENGVDQGSLTQNDARVTDLKFFRFFATSTDGIRTEITIESGTSTHYRSEKFYSATIIR